MKFNEFFHILAAIIILTAVISFKEVIAQNYQIISVYFLFAVIIILLAVFSKKLMAFLLDGNVEHRLWFTSRYGWVANWRVEPEIPAGIVFPLFFSLFSLGWIKMTSLLTYETTALKTRAARRFGYYSFTEMTDWHNALIGSAGIFAVLLLSLIGYLSGYETLARFATYYAFWNMIPISKLDGTQIFFGSRVLWTTLAVITLVFTLAALVIV